MAFAAILCGLAAGFFVHAGLSPSDMAAPQDHVRGDWIVEILSLFDFDGIGWGFLAAALSLFAFAGLSIWRVVDPVAVVASERGLAFHPSISRGDVVWHDIAEIGVAPQRRGGLLPPAPTLSITFTSPRRLRFSFSERTRYSFPAIEIGDGIAERFIACLPIVRGDAEGVPDAPLDGGMP